MYPKKKVNCTWSSKFAYALGLLATDGCLSKDGRHIDFTSKDLELVNFFKNYLGLSNKITKKSRSVEKEKKYFHIQFGDINFYEFLVKIGLTPAKSRTIGPLKIPRNYFPDFLRGCIDGDGNIRTFNHPESKYPQLRTRLFSASEKFLKWINSETSLHNIKGVINWGARVYVLEYAMGNSIKLFKRIYYKNHPKSLKRKFLIAKPFLRT